MVSAGNDAVREEGTDVGFVTATTDRVTIRNFAEVVSLIGAIAASGFRRFSTYRQATIAARIKSVYVVADEKGKPFPDYYSSTYESLGFDNPAQVQQVLRSNQAVWLEKKTNPKCMALVMPLRLVD